MPQHYYEASAAKHKWYVEVYYYGDGKFRVCIWRSKAYCSAKRALDAAAEWCQDNNIDAEMV